MAYELFDGKYSLDQIVSMPYYKLLDEIDREQAFQEKLNADRKARNTQ